MKRYARPRQTLIFILIGVTLMIALDVFILGGERPYRKVILDESRMVQAEMVIPEIGPPMPAALPEPVKMVEAPPKERNVAYGPPRENKNSMEANAIAPVRPRGKGVIALIIDDMGVDRRSKDIVALEPPLTLAYLPYANNLKEQTRQARARGHELMIHVPMEPMGNDDPGPNVLTTTMSDEEFMAALNGAFESFDGYVGINNHMGSKLTQNVRAMKMVMQELKDHNLLFIDSKTTPSSVAARVAAGFGVTYGSRDIFIDHNNDMASIRASLEKLEDHAYANGSAIAIGHPRENTVKALQEWLPTLKDKGLTIVPVSQLVRKTMPASAMVEPARPQALRTE